MKLEPLDDRVLVSPDAGQKKTSGGLFIADSAQEKPVMGIVVEVGQGKWVADSWLPTTLKVGDKVLYGKYTGTEVLIDGDKLYMMRESDIFSIVLDEPTPDSYKNLDPKPESEEESKN